mgnify:CR=1 FL=1
MRSVILAVTILSSAAVVQAAPGPTPDEAVVQVLTRMRATLRYRPDFPAPRGPHEWEAQRVLAAGTVNGCVESAKAFFTLFHEAFPSFKAVYLDSFNAAGNGGHAVVQVTGSGGRDFIVDAASFEKLPGRIEVSEEALATQVDFRKDRLGRVVQFQGRGDVFLEKVGDAYQMLVYPLGQVFDGPVLSRKSLRTLSELNQALADYAAAAKEYGDDPPLPPHWGGYRVMPEEVEFWQGRESRLHDRLRYRKDETGWVVERLSP